MTNLARVLTVVYFKSVLSNDTKTIKTKVIFD
jgi:hypothetical protein